MRQVNMIRFENANRQQIAVVGTDVRLCRGFPDIRVLSLLHSYTLSLEEVKSLLSRLHPYSFLLSFHKAACLRIFIISGLLVSLCCCRCLTHRIPLLSILSVLKS